MIEESKIALMTKLAIYDKKQGIDDRKITDYFMHDYICKKNIWTRFFVFIGGLIVLFIDYVNRILIMGENFFGLDLKAELINCITVIVGLWIAYSLIGILKHAWEYNISYRRLEGYKIILSGLDKELKKSSKEV